MSKELFKDSVIRLENALRTVNDAFELVALMNETMESNPGLVEGVIQGNLDVAFGKLGEVRTDYGEIVYPVEIAIRYLASKINYFEGEKDPLSPKSWSLENLVDFLQKYSGEVAELAGTHKISVNLPHRAAHIFALLNELGISREPLYFIELGASGGFLLSGLLSPKNYRRWSVSQPNFEKVDRSFWEMPILNQRENIGFGVDVSLPEIEWVISCVGDDLARNEMFDFMAGVGLTENLYKMNALDVFSRDGQLLVGELSEGFKPVVVACSMLYQLDDRNRNELERKVEAFIKPRDGLFVVTNQARMEGHPGVSGSLSYVKNGDGEKVSDVWVSEGNKKLIWKRFVG